MTQEQKINRRLAPLGLTVKDLTKEEYAKARTEQREIDKGQIVADGLLSSNELLSLKRRKTSQLKQLIF